MYPAKLGWRPWRLDLLLLLFFYQDKKRSSSEGGEVFPGTSRIAEGPRSLKLLTSKYVPSQTWLASLTSWSSFASFLLSREEKALCRGRGSLAGYIHISWMPETWLASLTPWSSFASFLLSREEKKVMKSEKHVSRQEKKVMRSNFAF